MSANDSALENWIARSLERRRQAGVTDNQTAPKAAANGLSDTDRMTALIEEAAVRFDTTDPRAVETLFAGQAVALDVIFKDFIKRRFFTFDNMRVALRAQAQCRSTFKTLADFRNPRLPPASQRPAKPVRRSPTGEGGNSNEQTIENGKSPE